MKSNWLLIACYCLTTIVVGVACRIEYLNVKSGYFLPRHELAFRHWVVPELDELIERTDDQIYQRRQNTALAEAMENGDAVPAEVPLGAPYSAKEQKFLDSMKTFHASHKNLQWWVGSFGIAQYFLAPAAFLVAIICAVVVTGWGAKSTAGVCAFLNALSILMMLTRNYWNA